ncbi:HemY protein [Orbus hercynius]|uniref:HemY protein n=1 Tax=Orbus hercynius TaxID=593135 RepID=A0A495RIH7_9GAMM|nr:heme biosynthesis HemY N-terminal domain-containing protein [Orbus hercynius]RKS87225.1 HemY protein [Orbus hercynius]
MLRILVIFLVLVAGMIIGPILANHQGIVLFQTSGYRIKMSLTTFILAQALLLLLLYIVYWLLKKLFYSKTSFGEWLRSKSPKKSLKRLEQAQLALLEGDYKKASKLLAKSAKGATNNTLTYLQAAQAEINQNQFNEAREHLEEAAKTCQDKERFAFKLVQLRLYIKSQQYPLANLAVEKLLEEMPRNAEVLRLADHLYYETKNYQAIIEILPTMYKSAAFDETQLDRFKNVAYIGRIKQLADNEGIDQMMKWWQAQPKIIKQNRIYQDTIEIYQDNLLKR